MINRNSRYGWTKFIIKDVLVSFDDSKLCCTEQMDKP